MSTRCPENYFEYPALEGSSEAKTEGGSWTEFPGHWPTRTFTVQAYECVYCLEEKTPHLEEADAGDSGGCPDDSASGADPGPADVQDLGATDPPTDP